MDESFEDFAKGFREGRQQRRDARLQRGRDRRQSMIDRMNFANVANTISSPPSTTALRPPPTRRTLPNFTDYVETPDDESTPDVDEGEGGGQTDVVSQPSFDDLTPPAPVEPNAAADFLDIDDTGIEEPEKESIATFLANQEKENTKIEPEEAPKKNKSKLLEMLLGEQNKENPTGTKEMQEEEPIRISAKTGVETPNTNVPSGGKKPTPKETETSEENSKKDYEKHKEAFDAAIKDTIPTEPEPQKPTATPVLPDETTKKVAATKKKRSKAKKQSAKENPVVTAVTERNEKEKEQKKPTKIDKPPPASKEGKKRIEERSAELKTPKSEDTDGKLEYPEYTKNIQNKKTADEWVEQNMDRIKEAGYYDILPDKYKTGKEEPKKEQPKKEQPKKPKKKAPKKEKPKRSSDDEAAAAMGKKKETETVEADSETGDEEKQPLLRRSYLPLEDLRII